MTPKNSDQKDGSSNPTHRCSLTEWDTACAQAPCSPTASCIWSSWGRSTAFGSIRMTTLSGIQSVVTWILPAWWRFLRSTRSDLFRGTRRCFGCPWHEREEFLYFYPMLRSDMVSKSMLCGSTNLLWTFWTRQLVLLQGIDLLPSYRIPIGCRNQKFTRIYTILNAMSESHRFCSNATKPLSNNGLRQSVHLFGTLASYGSSFWVSILITPALAIHSLHHYISWASDMQ